ncbi:glycosyltransferase family 4 protein [Pseudoalteromonas sp. MB47]|uniref:glycosyltransferase family 4 protein n=1 Tax=Pseudoalteromonas sp. MB47 TaxID=2588452 RepID=UPI00140E5FE8|nr:glycosyltransferase family 4 protein [Pseudoalteromonas sp. MB47]NHH89285.1 N,N'-diacetylbacillosaminyl-diphospho-undecaprenol alpha-1,3-N-acetylgalactosaminyltransferase [Pseudoalteromonas sp. MB47]
MKILYIVNVDWFFISHRLPIALEAMKNGYEVHIACGVTDKKSYLESLGIFVHPLQLTRSGTSLVKELKVLAELWRITKSIKPEVTHTVTIKGVVYGGIVTRLLKTKVRVASISGLGYVFIDTSMKAKLLKNIIKKFYSFALGVDTRVIFQNKNDKTIFVDGNIIKPSQSLLIRGSGVDLNQFKYLPEPTSQKTVMFLARLLKDKGLIEFCKAAEIVNKTENAKFVLVGDLDPDNPNSITEDELNTYTNNSTVEHWGYSTSVESVIPKSHIMVLPSYREGLPKSLLEAAACGRAVITTDVPGCRDAIEPNLTGLLVKVKDYKELAKAIQKLLRNDDLRKQFGEAGRSLAEESFCINDVVARHLTIYRGEN